MLIVGNGRLFTRRKEHPYIADGAVAVKDGIVCQIGTTSAVQKEYPDAEFIDAKQGMIMPALINAHEHCYSAMARGMSVKGYHPQGFLDILNGLWWKLDRHLTLEQVNLSAEETFLECIRNGVTTVFDHHASYNRVQDSLFAIEEAACETGVRTCLCYEVSDRDGMKKRNLAIKENLAYLTHVKRKKDPMRTALMGLHASFTLSNETLNLCAENTLADSGFHIHIAEGKEDALRCLSEHGKPICDRLMDFNMLGEKTIAAHAIHINEHEMELLRNTNTCVVHNPESNMGNACGCPETMKMMGMGVLTGLGTDGYTHDMFESLKAANLLHKHHLSDPNAGFREVPDMLFHNNAVLAKRHFHQELGVIEQGGPADIIVVSYLPPTPLTVENLNSHLLFGVNGGNVETTICNGKVLMKDRVMIGIDEEFIMANVRKEAAKLWSSINDN